MRMRFAAAIATGLLFLTGSDLAAGPAPRPQHNHERGSIIAVEPLGDMSHLRLQAIAAGFPGRITVQHAARLYRMTYWTVLKDTPTRASGLVAIPLIAGAAKGVVLYAHGTNVTRALAPSQADRIDGNEEAAIFAGNGFAVVLPDYIGLGISQVPHPYLIVQPQVDASIDLLRAARSVFAKRVPGWPSNLFLMGFSQGGQVIAGLHRALERRPLTGYRLNGSVGIAGPYDLRRTSLPKAIENKCRQCVGYLAWGVYAYANHYGHPLDQALKQQYVSVVPGLFDGSKSAEEVGAALPDNPEVIFQPRFLTAMRRGGDNWFTRALARNETYAWVPVAPFRLYFGDTDVDVPPSAARAFFRYAKSRGGNVSLCPLAHADHQVSAALSYAPALLWFGMANKRALPNRHGISRPRSGFAEATC